MSRLDRPKARVTLVVAPRERFSFARASLESVLEHTHCPYELVYVDVASPPHVRRFIERKAREHGFESIRVDRIVSPNQARNIGAKRVRTPYAVFIENDVLVQPGWLENLVACADETDAWVVGPLLLDGEAGLERVHLAGGDLEIEERDGRRLLRDVHHLSGARPKEVVESLVRAPTGVIEFHCMLVRMEAYRKLGPFDEELLSLFEYDDFCLAATRAGQFVMFEPTSVVTYVPPQRLRWYDCRYFLTRWSDDWNQASVERFYQKWRLDNDPAESTALKFARFQRRLFLAGTRARLRATFGASVQFANPVVRLLERLLAGTAVRD